MLLGITGDQVLPADVYARSRADTLAQSARQTVQADILKEGPGAEHLHSSATEFALRLDG